MSVTPTHQVQQRRELANYLRIRREKSPGSPGTRRRVPGLRREEVAERAGISTSWYTWLEQGRDVRVSAETLLGIAEALCMTDVEREQLFILAELAPPRVVLADGAVPANVAALVRSAPSPAFVICGRWDLLEWNQAASVLFGNLETRPVNERNLLWLLFMEPAFRTLFLEWERMAHCVTSHFRLGYHSRLGNPHWTGFAQKLERASPEFRDLWSRCEVARSPDWRKWVHHPPLQGKVAYDPVTLDVPPNGDLRVMFYQPAVIEA